MAKKALIGTTSKYYHDAIKRLLDENEKKIVWSRWTWKLDYSIRHEFEELNRKGETFNIYFYFSPSGGGSGKGRTPGDGMVWYKGVVAKFEYEDYFFGTRHIEDTVDIDKTVTGHGWYKFVDIVELKPHREPEDFTRLDKPGNPRLTKKDFTGELNPKSPFIVVEDLDF